MKTLARGLVLSLGVLLLAGCANSGTARLQENSALFQSLTPNEQQLIKAGRVRVGFTADMVYLAMGNPAKVLSFKNEGSNVAVDAWVYTRMTVHADRISNGVITQIDPYAYDREVLYFRASSPIYDSSGMIQPGPYYYEGIVEHRVQNLSLIFQKGKVVAIRVIG